MHLYQHMIHVIDCFVHQVFAFILHSRSMVSQISSKSAVVL